MRGRLDGVDPGQGIGLLFGAAPAFGDVEMQPGERVLGDLIGELAGGVGGSGVAAAAGLGHVVGAGKEDLGAVPKVEAEQVRIGLDPSSQALVSGAGGAEVRFDVGGHGVGEPPLEVFGFAGHAAAVLALLVGEEVEQSLGPVHAFGFEGREGDFGLVAGAAPQGQDWFGSEDGVVVEESLVDVADLLDVDLLVGQELGAGEAAACLGAEHHEGVEDGEDVEVGDGDGGTGGVRSSAGFLCAPPGTGTGRGRRGRRRSRGRLWLLSTGRRPFSSAMRRNTRRIRLVAAAS